MQQEQGSTTHQVTGAGGGGQQTGCGQQQTAGAGAAQSQAEAFCGVATVATTANSSPKNTLRIMLYLLGKLCGLANRRECS